MNMIFRTLWIFLNRKRVRPSQIDEVTEYQMRVYPTDLDLLFHVNNGVYFSLMDFGRWDMIFRNGLFDLCKKNDWYAVVAGESIKFRKSLTCWQKFTLQTKTIGCDDRYFFIQQKFIYKNDVMASGLVKVRFLKKKGGSVSPEEILKELNAPKVDMKKLSDEWFAIENEFMA